MRPTLYDFGIEIPFLGRLDFPAYFTLLALSFAVGLYMSWREAGKLGLDRERVLDLDLWIVVWALLGARVLHVLADGHLMEYVNLCLDPTKVPASEAKVAVCKVSAECGWDYLCTSGRCHPARDCLAVIKVWRGGLAYYGGFIFATAFSWWFTRKHRMDLARAADLSAPWVAFGLAVTRLGCFLNGCCYGKRTDVPWAVTFPRGSFLHDMQIKEGLVSAAQNALAVHATQVYLAALNLLLFFLLYYVVRQHKRFHGEVFAWLLIGKGVVRSFVEIWRDDERGVLFGWLSTSQMLSVPLVALGIWLLVRGRRQAATLPA